MPADGTFEYFTPSEEAIVNLLRDRGLLTPVAIANNIECEQVTTTGRTAMTIFEAIKNGRSHE
jgi:hypothetical protein